MFEHLDGERASSFLILLVSLALVIGLLLEQAHIVPHALTIGATIAGLLVVIYGIAVGVYLLLRSQNKNQKSGDSYDRSDT